MNAILLSRSVDGPKRLLAKVGSPLPFASTCSPAPFALSLSKGQAEPVEAFGMRHEGFDRLSPNGDEARASIPQPERFFADLEVPQRAASRRPFHVSRFPRGAVEQLT
jgi:hypothetical protein